MTNNYKHDLQVLKRLRTKQTKALIKYTNELEETYRTLITFLYIAQKCLNISYESDVKKIKKNLDSIRAKKNYYKHELQEIKKKTIKDLENIRTQNITENCKETTEKRRNKNEDLDKC